MGERKLAFAARKNFERKTYTKLWPLNVTIPLDLVTVLPVRIPLDVTHPPHHAVCVTPDNIRQRVQARPSELPKGWIVIESPPSKLILAKPVYVEARSQVTMTFTVVIEEDFSWSVRLPCGVSIPRASPLFESLPTRVGSFPEVVNVLNTLSAAIVCLGNHNDNYQVLRGWKAGEFLGQKQ